MTIREQYERERYVLLPGLLPEPTAERLALATVDLPSRRVTVASPEYTQWDELDVKPRPELTHVFLSEPVVGIVLDAIGRTSVADNEVLCWANRYRAGERIAPHRDGSGTVQCLVCLKAPIESRGGVLHLDTTAGARACPLAPGDAVVWEATTIEHWITPLVATVDDPEPERVVLVGRYYLPGDDQ
jgi:alkylated DNA repair dioxygenase AlkB